MKRHLLVACMLALLAASASAQAEGDQSPALEALARALDAPHQILNGQLQTYTWQINVFGPPTEADPKGKKYTVTVVRRGKDEFAVSATETPAGYLSLVRTIKQTAIIDHTRKRVFLGEGPLPDGKDALAPGEFARRLIGAHGELSAAMEVARSAGDSRILALQLVGSMKLAEKPASGDAVTLTSSEPIDGRKFTLTIVPGESRISDITWTSPAGGGRVLYSLQRQAHMPAVPGEGYQTIKVERAELERSLVRGLPRGAEIMYRLGHPRTLRNRNRRRAGGLLLVRQGQRICMLNGSPGQIGTQHGTMLKREVRRVVNSVIYTLALHQSLERGKWMLDEFRAAWKAQSGQIPDEFKEELAALAEAANVDLEELQLANMLPSLFHGSGFALGGGATSGGKLYQGRVLDYLAGIGLQDAAVLFVVNKSGAKPFVSVGYAGMIGCVTGMNAEKIAITRIGGGEDGRLDGAGMQVLVRQVLERSSSLEEALAVLKNSTRVGEDSYVISDGKTGEARGVTATADGVSVFRPGRKIGPQAEPLADVVVISGGQGLKALLARITDGYGRIDLAAAKKLMDYPVAAKGGNLHNVLFVPQDLLL
ncbi:MAG: hypothetical protein GWP05_01615, partial [Anaerolineaceae bacterium]|nr:hypothetical protein [Anaerolineaceae bacterium]